METYKRVRKFIVQPILEVLGEDGELKGEEALPPETLYHPYNLTELIVRIEREQHPERREQTRR